MQISQETKDIVLGYLYGDTTKPADMSSDSLIRDQTLSAAQQFIYYKDVEEYMAGPGRFALGSMSSLVDQFFRPEAHQGLPTLQPGVYTKTQLASLYNNDSYGINFQQYDYQDSIDDLAERTWTWNSTAIKLADDVQFVVDANGNRFIDNYYLVPRYNSENFDFDTNDFLLNITADYVQDLMDLSRIGRTVEIEFTGGVSSRITYTLQDFQNDRNLESQQFNPTPNLLPKINDLLDQLWDSDITQFVHEGKPVLYGTKGDDLLLAKKVEENSYFSDELEQDVHLIGGDGNDLLLGMKGRDRLDGGKDNDVLLGGGNEDQLQNIENANQFDLASQYFASDEDKDILNGGLGDDTYYILSTQKVLSNSINWGDQSASGNPLSHFDVVFTWEDGSNAAQKSFDPSTVPNIDSIIDEDGKGEILLNTRDIDSNARLFKFSNPGQLLKLQDGVDINIGWDVYVKNDGSGEDVFFIQDGQKLYGFSGVLAEAGAGYADHWGGLHAHFVIEDFSDGDFGIDLAGAEPMSSGGTGGPGSGSGASGGSGGSNTNGGGAGPGWAISSAAFHSPVISPLVFDLDGDGLETITLDNATAYFDLDNDGFAEKTAWIAPDDGFLAYDANGNGTIDDNSELFGSGDVDGFSILAAHDSNGDGLINASDTIFNDLRVWQDANGDGVSASGELISLTQAGITEINLSADYVDNWIDAGWISHSSGYTQTSGATGTIYDIWFENDQMLSVDRNGTSVTITNPDVLALPDLAGYGTVTDLQIALNSDDALRLELKALVEGSVNLTQAELWSQAEAFLLKWVGVDQIATGSRGQHVDAQHLEFLEALHGVDFEAVGGASDPGYRAGADLEIYYTTVINSYIAKLIIQIPDALSALSGDPADGATSFYASFASLNYQVDSDSLSGDFSAVLTEIKDDLAQQSAGGNIDGFLRHMEIFSALRTDLGNSDAAFTGWLSLKMMFGGFEQQYVMIAREILETTGILSGTTGSDTIDGTILNDFVYGAVGDDTLSGGTGNDVYLYNLGDGADVISDGYLSGNADKLLLGIGIVPNEVTITRSSTNPDDVTLTFSDGGTVLLKEQVRQGDGFGVEEIIFVDGTTWTDATIREMLLAASQTDGDDSVLGYNGEDDTLQGGLGNDNLDGLQGDDTYVYSLGDGADTISEGFNAGTADKLQLGAGILPVEVTVTRSASNPDDVTLTFSDGGTILLKEQVRQGSGFGVEEIIFDDGTIWTKATIRSMVLSASQTDGDDTVLGFNGEDDTLEGGLGNDDLDGLQGDDTYIYSLGDGADTISEGYNSGTVDKLQLGASILPAEVTVTRSVIDPDDVTLTMSDGGTILLKEQVRQGSDYGVEEIIFDDGTIWTKATLQTMLIAASQTAGDDTVLGFNGEDDTLEGGLGNDDLNGLQGDDTYIYNLGDGSDTITEAFLGGSLDKLQLGAGITVASVTLAASSTDADDAVLTFSDGGTITLIKQLNTGSHYGVEEIIFADGTVWTKSDVIATIAGQSGGSSSTITHDGTAAGETINGTADDDVIRGQGGDDTLNGKQGNDTYLYSSGDGNDFLDDQDTSTTSVDILKLTDLTTADVTLSREGNDLIVTTIATGERIQVDDQFYSASYNYGVEQLQFVDGTIWDRDKMKLEAWYRGTDQAETINASTTDDTIDGGLGDDTLNGKAGNDTYVYSSGDGNDFLDDQDTSTTSVDILKLTDLNAADVTLSREGNDLFVMTIATGEKIQVDDQFYSANYNYGIEQIVFADGSILDRAQIKDAAWYRGTDQADTINASTTDDTLDGGLGDDTLNGKAGSDTYIYRSGDGNDFLDDQDISTTSVDILKLTDLNAADVTLSKLGNDLIVTTDANGQTIQLDDQFYSTNYNYGVEQIAFADGSTIDRDGIRQMVVDDQQTSGADQITGFSNQDDTFIFVGSDFGHDTVTDFEAGTSDGDVVEFDTNVFGAYADLLAAAADDGTDTTITIDADSSVVLKDVVIADLHQDDFRFV